MVYTCCTCSFVAYSAGLGGVVSLAIGTACTNTKNTLKMLYKNQVHLFCHTRIKKGLNHFLPPISICLHTSLASYILSIFFTDKIHGVVTPPIIPFLGVHFDVYAVLFTPDQASASVIGLVSCPEPGR